MYRIHTSNYRLQIYIFSLALTSVSEKAVKANVTVSFLFFPPQVSIFYGSD